MLNFFCSRASRRFFVFFVETGARYCSSSMPPDNSWSGAFPKIQSVLGLASGTFDGKLMPTPVWELSWIDGAAAGSLTELCPIFLMSLSCRIDSLIRQAKSRKGGERVCPAPRQPFPNRPRNEFYSVMYCMRAPRDRLPSTGGTKLRLARFGDSQKSRNVPSLSSYF